MTVHENEVQLQLYARAPAPSRDYYGLTITQTKIILNIWNISYGPHVYPKRHVSSLEDFPDQRYMQHDIQRTFGEYALQFAKSFAAKEHLLQCLPMKVFLKIIRYLATNDILRLSQTSKIFFDICNSEAVWRVIYKKRIKRRMMLSDIEKGVEIGWKQALKAKILSKVTLRNLLDKNETKTVRKLTSNTISDLTLNKPDTSSDKLSNFNSNKIGKMDGDSQKEIIGRLKDIKDVKSIKSTSNLKKLAINKNEVKNQTKSLAQFRKNEDFQKDDSLSIKKSWKSTKK